MRDSAHEKLYKLLNDPIPEVGWFAGEGGGGGGRSDSDGKGED